jgi:hypothetical protein
MYYNIKNDNVTYYGDAEYYHAKWTNMDSQVQLYNGKVNAQAYGRICHGAFESGNKTWNQSYPDSGRTYSFTPPWHGTYVTILNTAANEGQFVYSTLTWKRGSATYTLNANYKLPQKGGWPKYGGC